MISYKPLTALIVLLCIVKGLNAQVSDTIPPEIEPGIDSNQVKLNAVLRPLRQIAGAPAAFYTYFWEFGDGTYSFDRSPVHHYRDTGDYDIRLFATNNYDDGKKPPTRLRRVRVEEKKKRTMLAMNNQPSFFSGTGSLEIRSNQQPKPGEDMVLLLGYRNRPGAPVSNVSGSVMLLYNEKQFSQNAFDFADARTYHQEKTIGYDSLIAMAPADASTYMAGEPDRTGLFSVSGTEYDPLAGKKELLQWLKQETESFRTQKIWRIDNVKPGEEKFMFISINTLPGMIKDTNAMVTIAGLFIPDDPSMEPERFNLEMQIVASHDPNKLQLRNRRLNYRFTTKNKDNTYKVRFQNTGKGPAKRIAITVSLPGMLNSATLKVVDMKPACVWCSTAYPNQSCIDTLVFKDSIQFIFKNIYLPGTQQEGVTDPDSTMGYIKYVLNFNKGMKKLPFTSSAAIVFDKNEPIYTNRSVGRFRKGLSPGIMVGYNTALGANLTEIPKQNYTIGFTLSEYSPYKPYLQWELYLQPSRKQETYLGRRMGGDTVIDGRGQKVEYRDQYHRVEVLGIEAVPIQVRYNLKSWIGTGAGLLVAGEISRKTSQYIEANVISANGVSAMLKGVQNAKTEAFSKWRGAVFADIQLGMVRVGPALGVRLLHYINPAQQRIYFFATWRI
ncbi:PKD domain-containing protein [Pseudoflavitalea sp. G-6-1-2]|uniref:PKD domain-containing protein n=1 Tax=Pseudoflavitalea sp. G-6-1-2 TaxID=2728841 RepID=UPI00146AAFA2|nr:PKD domain-containing protein [Pseudoflavitalea sp. G-6-1-2]NML23472.1 PKD domain-containing protein [Pseudoflavitalea sp. G-6-1-2]